jgi:hypothetical protein
MEVNYYRLGKQYASRPFDDPLWEDIPAMDYQQRIEFNRGYDDGLNSPSLAAKLFVATLCIIVVLAIIGFVK